MSLTAQTERSHQLASSATIGQYPHMTPRQEKGLDDLGKRLADRLRSRHRVSYLHSVDTEREVQVDRIANPEWKHNQRCWEVKGKCLQNYTDMETGLRKELNQSRQESFGEVGVKLFMIGKTPERAKPIIIISSKDKRSREAAKKAIIKSGILTTTNFEVGVLKYLPSGPTHPVVSSGPRIFDFLKRSRRKTSDDSNDSNDSKPSSSDRLILLDYASAYYDPRHQLRRIGMPIFVKGSANQLRKATANIIYNGPYYGYVTAAHVFSPSDQDSCSIDSGGDDIGIPFDSDSDDEGYCDEQISSTSGSTPKLVESTQYQSSDDDIALLLHEPTGPTHSSGLIRRLI